MSDNGTLLCDRPFEHSYPHCWRHKTPTAFRVTPQWFISMDAGGLRERALKAISGVSWVPGWGEERIRGMVENRPDWCISRQRTWGVPITLFVDKQTRELHPDTVGLMERIADHVEQHGVDSWYADDVFERFGVDPERYEQVGDILDVWFDSGVSHRCVLDERADLRSPAELYLEGSDQHRGWFQSSLLSSVAMHGRAPYRQVLTHGFVVDAEGRKMSKSTGNVVSPIKVMNTLGADVMRLWVAAADYRGEMSVSDEILKRVSDAYRRIRNTARFLLGNLDGFTQDDLLEPAKMLPLDRWAVARAAALQEEVKTAFENYQFLQVYQKVHNFCAFEMGAFYLDILKDRLYTTGRDSDLRRSAQTAMYHVLEELVRWIAPILSFTAEEIWQLVPGERADSVFMSTWYEGPPPLGDEPYGAGFWRSATALVDRVKEAIEPRRASKEIRGSLDADVFIMPRSDAGRELLAAFGDELRFLLIVSEATVVDEGEAPEDAFETDDYVIWVRPSEAEKCVRCWHRREDVGSNPAHPELCGRCVENVDGPGESRRMV
jgi:isoleucyl-tRNA synthetase